MNFTVSYAIYALFIEWSALIVAILFQNYIIKFFQTSQKHFFTFFDSTKQKYKTTLAEYSLNLKMGFFYFWDLIH